jgi:glutamine phosphoribosylpyrophosphate amidotransferase
MCGILGLISPAPVAERLVYGLIGLQHRGQDATGIATAEPNGVMHLQKKPGQVREAFRTRDMRSLLGNVGLGHVRYATKGTASAERQAAASSASASSEKVSHVSASGRKCDWRTLAARKSLPRAEAPGCSGKRLGPHGTPRSVR